MTGYPRNTSGTTLDSLLLAMQDNNTAASSMAASMNVMAEADSSLAASVLSSSAGLSKALVAGTSGVAIAGATEFHGIIVTVILAGAYARFFDAASASGDYFAQMPLTAIGTQILPRGVKLTTGLYVQPSSALTSKFWVLYR